MNSAGDLSFGRIQSCVTCTFPTDISHVLPRARDPAHTHTYRDAEWGRDKIPLNELWRQRGASPADVPGLRWLS